MQDINCMLRGSLLLTSVSGGHLVSRLPLMMLGACRGVTWRAEAGVCLQQVRPGLGLRGELICMVSRSHVSQVNIKLHIERRFKVSQVFAVMNATWSQPHPRPSPER
jgi:hypothetical protein